MARLRIVVVAQETDGDVYPLATCKFYAPGTATASGSSTSGTPFAGSLYAAISGGSPISTTQTLGSNGTLVVWTTSKSRVDVGIEPAGGGTAFVRQYEAAELDPADVVTSVSGEQSVIQTGTLAAPSLAWTSDLDTGFNVDSDGDVGVSKDGVGILETASTTTYLRSPDGTEAATLTDAGVFSAPGVLEGMGVYNVLDHDIVAGTTSSSAAANTTALQALFATITGAGNNYYGGVIYFPPGEYPFNATTFNHGNSIGIPVYIKGAGANTTIRMYGTTGPFWDFASASTSQLARSGISDLTIKHDTIPTSGATIRLGLVQTFVFDKVRVLYDSASTKAALICVQVGVSTLAANDITFRDCQFWAGDFAGTQIGVDFATGGTGCGSYKFFNTQIKSNATDGIGLRFNNSTTIDTVFLGPGTVFEDCLTGMQKTSGAGEVANLYASQVVFDSCTTYCVRCEPAGLNRTWSFDGCWFSAGTGGVALLFSNSNGGTCEGIMVRNSAVIGAGTTTFYASPGVSDVIFAGNNCLSTDAGGGYHGVEIGGAGASSNAVVTGNLIDVPAAATSSLYIGAGLDSFVVGANMLRGKDMSINGTLSNARVVLDRAYKA